MPPYDTQSHHLYRRSDSHSSKRRTMPVSLNKNTLIRTEKCRFLIMDAPTDKNLDTYLQQMKRHNVTALVRACEPSYDKAPVEKAGIFVEDLFFADGTSPTDDVLTRWLSLTREQFCANETSGKKKKRAGKGVGATSGGKEDDDEETSKEPACVAVHCVAGLGRAPVLVALALIEHEKLDPFSAIEKIRGQRRGAFNSAQLTYLEKYKRRRNKKLEKCIIM